MNYRRKNNKIFFNKNNKIKITIFFFIFTIFLFGSQIKTFINLVNSPVSNTANATKSIFSNFFTYLKSKTELEQKNKNLIEENKKLEIENLSFDLLFSENKELKQNLNYFENEKNIIFAKVLNKPENSPNDTFIIDKGLNVNINEGMSIYFLDLEIGKIEEVYKNSSIVKLNSSISVEIPVDIFISEDEKISAKATGQNSGFFKIVLPKDIEIVEGQKISYNDSLLGVVSGIEIESTNTFQNIYFRYPFKLSEINWVTVDTEE